MFIRPTALISAAVTLRFGILLLMECIFGVTAAIILIAWNVPVPSIVAKL